MRHGAISDWAQTRSATILLELMQWAGHSSLASIQRYAHYYADVDSSRVAAIDALVAGVPEVDNVVAMRARRAR